MRPELKGDAWQPKLETVTQDTHTVDVSQVISMQSKGGVKLLGRGSLAEECRQRGGEKLEQNVKRYCDEAELLPTSPCGGLCGILESQVVGLLSSQQTQKPLGVG